MIIRTYASPLAFKQALEQHLRNSTNTGPGFARKRQMLVFDRLLARIVAALGDSVTLKGGLVLEIRLGRARTTKDVDLRLMGSPDNILARLQEAGRHDLGDFMTFEMSPDAEHPDIQNGGMLYDGLRFRAVCRLAGKVYGQPFGLDIAFGDPIFGEPEVVAAKNELAFAGIAAPTLRIYPLESHIAEKVHAYTLPRKHPNSRVKDLPDLALLASVRDMDGRALHQAIHQTFAHRATHPVPESFPDPPASWASVYERMASHDGLPWTTLAQVTEAVRSFLDPVLAGKALLWEAKPWTWNTGKPRQGHKTFAL